MALIQCKECEEPVSTEAASCPHCGAPQESPVPPSLSAEPPPIQPKEETIYSDNAVTVTGRRIIIWGTTYALRNVTSVSTISTPPRMVKPILLLIVGVCILLLTFIPLNDSKAPVGVYIIAGAMIVGAILWMVTAKTHFHIGLSTASGELHVLTSKDKAYVQRVAQNINEAIVRYK
jgi:hypothetical protein